MYIYIYMCIYIYIYKGGVDLSPSGGPRGGADSYFNVKIKTVVFVYDSALR